MKKIFLLIMLFSACNLFADDRTQLPPVFQNSYLGFDLGYSNFNFTNSNLTSGFQAQHIDNNGAMVRVFAGHYFNPYFAVQVTYMRPAQWVQFNNLSFNQAQYGTNTVWLNYFILSLKPTLPLTDRWAVYGEVGPVYVSRYGIDTPSGTAISTVGIVAPMTGVGATYRFGNNWHADISANSIWASSANNQPATIYAMAGLYYLFNPEQAIAAASSAVTATDDFPLQEIDVGLLDRSVFNWDATPYFTDYAPVFWNGEIQVHSGNYVMYEKNAYHGQRWISLDWGIDTARWVSLQQRNVFYTASIYPALRVWLIRKSLADVYFTYSAAGPSYISSRNIDSQNEGQHFTFQDFLGVGAFLGQAKNLTVNLKIMHYSSGNLMPPANPGVKIPVILGLGYSF